VSHSFIRIHPENGEEEVSLVPEGAIDAAFSQAGDAHQIVERSGRISLAPELIAHRCEYLVLVELSWSRHVVSIMQAVDKKYKKNIDRSVRNPDIWTTWSITEVADDFFRKRSR
jgi:hypothetical protein